MQINPEELTYSWTAEVELKNGTIVAVWHTWWPMGKQLVKRILWIASDYPKCKISKW